MKITTTKNLITKVWSHLVKQSLLKLTKNFNYENLESLGNTESQLQVQ